MAGRHGRIELIAGTLAALLAGAALPSSAQTPVSFNPAVSFVAGALPITVGVADVNGDGKLDLLTVNTGANTVSVLLGNGAGTFGPKTDFATGAVPHGLAIADLDGDGNPDLIVANTGANTVSVLLGTGTGTFAPAMDFPTGAAPFFVAVGDLNRDGIPDLVVVNVGADTVSVLLGVGDGTLGLKTDFPVGAGPRSVAIGDVNEDGILDLVVANFGSNTISVLLGTGTGSFAAKTDLATGPGTGPFSVAIEDLNGNGQHDLAVANVNANTVSVFLNTIASVIAVTPSSQGFGNVAVGSTADRTFTVTNAGGGMLTGSASTSLPFSIVSGGSYNLGAGASQTVIVGFQPTAVAIVTGNVNFTYSGGTVSRGLTGTGTNPVPVPVLGALSPSSATAGGAAFTLTVNGTNFVASSIVRWNGSNRTTTFVSGTELRAAIPAGDITTAGTTQITVFTPLPGGGTSGALTFTITSQMFTLTVTVRASGVGSIVSTPAGINCSSVCSGTFTVNAVTLTGAPAADASFKSWNGSCGGASPSCTVALGPTAVTATFSAVFTDATLTAQGTPIKAVHITDLRSAINTLRTRNGLSAFAYTDATLTPGTTVVKGIHLTELGTALREMGPYTDPAIVVRQTVITATHLNELRKAVRDLE